MKALVLDALLGGLSAPVGAAILNAPKIQLFKTPVLVGPDTLLADLTEADYDGYAAGGIVQPALSAAAQSSNGTRVKLANVTFIAGGALAPGGQTIYGYAVVGNAGADLYLVESFAEPVDFGVPGDFLDLAVVWPEPAYRPAA